MADWTKVVTQPLGLTGFALFLVFGYLARAKSSDERRWLSPVAVAVAVVALGGGLVLAYLQMPKPAPPAAQTVAAPAQSVAAPAKQQTNQVVQQSTTGAGSPAVQGVQGDVTITVDQSGATKVQKPAQKKTDQSGK
jgi:hypothetical protein